MYRPTLALTMHAARAALDAGLAAIANGQDEFDLGGLTAVDSAAIATLLAWQRAAAERGRRLRFTNPSENLQSLARLYDLDGLLHFHAHAHA